MLHPENNALALTFDDDLGAVLMDWNGFMSSSEFYEANERVLELLKKKKSLKIIADLRNMKIIKLEDQEWLSKNWFPRIIAAGLSFVAIVESDDFFNRLTVNSITEKINNRITVKYFKTYLGARSWIRNV